VKHLAYETLTNIKEMHGIQQY